MAQFLSKLEGIKGAPFHMRYQWVHLLYLSGTSPCIIEIFFF